LDSMHTALSFDISGATLVVTSASNQFNLYDVELLSLKDWSREYAHSLPRDFVQSFEKMVGISFDPYKKSSLILYSTTFFCFIDLKKPVPPPEEEHYKSKKKKVKKRRKLSRNFSQRDHGKFKKKQTAKGKREEPIQINFKPRENFVRTKKYKFILFLEFINENEIIIVERRWIKIRAVLPLPFAKKKFERF